MPEILKRLDQHRHELKALRYLLELHPKSLADPAALPAREDFQIPDSRKIYDALVAARTKDEAIAAVRRLDLDETEVEDFLGIADGHFYYTYPGIVRERGAAFRAGRIALAD
jgi:hypothetical protein